MAKIPYDVVALEANKLLDNLYLAKDLDEAYEMYNVYLAFLEARGWTDQEFNAETIKRIDQGWDIAVKKVPEVIKKNKKHYLN